VKEYNHRIFTIFFSSSQLEYSKLKDEKYVKNEYTHSAFLKNTSDINSQLLQAIIATFIFIGI